METKTYRFEQVTNNHDKKRKPLSAQQRAGMQGEYRYYGAQSVIDHVNDYLFDGEYLLIAEDGENLKSGKQDIAQIVEGQFWLNNHAHIVQTNELCNLRYLCYLLNSIDISGYITGSAQPKLSQSNMNAIPIELPNRAIQDKIVGILHSLDKKIDVNTQINRNLSEQLKTVFDAWFYKMEPFGGKEPAGTEYITIEKLCSTVTKGTTPTTLGMSFTEEGVNFIKGETILDNHGFDRSKLSYIEEETHEKLKRSQIQVGDIVFTIAGTLGRFALVDDSMVPANTNQAVAIVRANKVSSEYLYSFFLGNWHNDYYTKRIQQAVQANLSLGTIKSLPIMILPDEYYHQYLSIISPLINESKRIEKENLKLAELRDSLLLKLMSGELDVSDLEI